MVDSHNNGTKSAGMRNREGKWMTTDKQPIGVFQGSDSPWQNPEYFKASWQEYLFGRQDGPSY